MDAEVRAPTVGALGDAGAGCQVGSLISGSLLDSMLSGQNLIAFSFT